MTVFNVKFLNLTEQTKEEFEYSNLMDALRVVKETSLDGVKMSNDQFDTELIHLLTSGFIYRGKKPLDEYVIMLHKRLENDELVPVYGPGIVPFVAVTPLPVANVNVPTPRTEN
ncbi:hypothetical protein [Streptomyces anandii]|uniref:hypothetical protein n=1 Tax=Streptomyces anandii TaxID=285454 RepID=UPI0036768C70